MIITTRIDIILDIISTYYYLYLEVNSICMEYMIITIIVNNICISNILLYIIIIHN